MAMSRPARRALEAAIRLNPDAALLLRAILLTSPDSVKYKPEDAFGPLGMLVVSDQRAPTLPRRFRGYQRPCLPRRLHKDAVQFREEWLARVLSKAELAAAIEACLRASGEDLPPVQLPWRNLIPPAGDP
jgi:hypothetical protein